MSSTPPLVWAIPSFDLLDNLKQSAERLRGNTLQHPKWIGRVFQILFGEIFCEIHDSPHERFGFFWGGENGAGAKQWLVTMAEATVNPTDEKPIIIGTGMSDHNIVGISGYLPQSPSGYHSFLLVKNVLCF